MIAILGTGRIGGALARGLAARGQQVLMGSRTPSGTDRTSIAQAASAAEIVVLATPFHAAQAVLAQAGDLSEKILIDCTNPFSPDRSGLAVGHDTSAAEMIAQWAPGARVVKTFNHIGWEQLPNPVYPGRAAMFYCGDDAAAKQVVKGLIEDLRFVAVDAGPLRAARLLEPLGMLWSQLAREQGLGRKIAFALLGNTERA
jgi:8-hydroxy-5-deazaflavin:NADPH oxidoreductase